MKKVLISGWYNNKVHITRCIRCSCVFQYNDTDVRGTSIQSKKYEINCPECGWIMPGIKMEVI